MDEREGGYIKLWRRLESWPLYRSLRSGEQAHVITTLLLMANWKTSVVQLNGRRVEIAPGQILASEETIARRAKTTRKVVRRMLSGLVKDSFLTRTVLSTGPSGGPGRGPTVTLLTICNWEQYQAQVEVAGPTKAQNEVQSIVQIGARQGTDKAPTRAPSKEGEEGEEDLIPPIPPTEKLAPATRPRPAPSRVGVGAPSWEAEQHWLTVAWPAMATGIPSPVTTQQRQQLAELSARHTPAEVCARMDRAVADPFWADKLDLETFLAKFDRFAQRNTGPPANPRGMAPVGTNWDEKPW